MPSRPESTAAPAQCSRRSIRADPRVRAGLLSHDIVVRLDGVPVTGVDDLIRLLDRNRIGRPIAIEVMRLGRLRSFEVTPGERKPG